MKDKKLEIIDNIELDNHIINKYKYNDEIYYMGKEVADYLDYSKNGQGYRNVTKMLKNIEKHNIRKISIMRNNDSIKGKRNYQQMIFVSTSGLIDILVAMKTLKSKQLLEKLDINIYHTHKQIKFEKDLRDYLKAITKKYNTGKLLKLTTEYKIKKYRVDFFIKELDLIIEFDELYHNEKNMKKKDKKRDNELYGMGYDVIRIRENNKCEDLLNLLLYIIEEIKSHKSRRYKLKLRTKRSV